MNWVERSAMLMMDNPASGFPGNANTIRRSTAALALGFARIGPPGSWPASEAEDTVPRLLRAGYPRHA